MIEPKLLMRYGFAISFIGHVAVLTLGLIFAGANPFDAVPAEAITVDIVTPDEIEQAPQTSVQLPTMTSAPEAAPPAAPTAAAMAAPLQPAPPPTPSTDAERSVSQAPPRSQPMEPVDPAQSPAPNIADVFGLPLALPDGRLGGGFDAPAIDTANISADEITMFRAHLKTCLIRPGPVAPTDKVKVVLRVVLKPDGTLAATPTLIEATASLKGPLLMESAISGLKACQPYAMLPADKYKEWKVLDLSFTPQDFTGG